MKIRQLFIMAPLILAGTFSIYAQTSSSNTITLEQCFKWAKEKNERILIAGERIRQLDAQRRQTIAAALPYLSFNSSTLYQDTSGLESTSGDSTRSTQSLKRRTVSSFRVQQPIFHGFKEFQAFKQVKALTRAQEAALQNETLVVIFEVAQSFYSTVLLEKRQADLNRLAELLQDRIKELRQRVQLGKSRESELLVVESELAGVQSDVQQIQGQVAIAREDLSYLVGQDIRNSPLDHQPSSSKSAPLLEDELKKAENRSDIQAAKDRVLANRYGVSVARADYFPLVDVTGNYYTHRRGFQSDIDWDVTLDVEVPIFQSGAAAGRTREAKSLLKESEYEFSETQREAQADIRRSHARLMTSLAQIGLLQEAFKKADRSYRLHIKEYRLGLVDNLDVLNALRDLENRELALNQAVIQSELDVLSLKISTEEALEILK